MEWKRTACWSIACCLSIATVHLLLGLGRAAMLVEVRMDLAGILITDRKMNGQPFVTFSPRSLYSCALECKRRSRCQSFNFHFPTLSCELNKWGSQAASANLQREAGYWFSDATDWPDTLLGPCHSAACSDSQMCMTDASGLAVCVSTECGPAPAVTNAQLTDAVTREVGRSTNYTCDNSYIQTGNSTITCRTDGQWSPPQFQCTVTDCGPAPDVPLANKTSEQTAPGSITTYVCTHGVLVNGPAEIACSPDGIWPPVTFSCVGFQTEVSGNTGIVLSRNYPNNYADNDDVLYTITLEQAGPQTVKVNLTTNIEYKNQCDYDYLIINNDGLRYCGAVSTTKIITVSGTTWNVLFHSDFMYNFIRGFRIDYAVV